MDNALNKTLPPSAEELAGAARLLQRVHTGCVAFGGLLVGFNAALLMVADHLVRHPFANLANIVGLGCGLGFFVAARLMRRRSSTR